MWTILESSADKTAHLPEFDEPLILGEEPPARSSWLKGLMYFLLIMTLLASLLAQTFYFYQDYFLRHAQWRPLLVSACEHLGCELAPERNPAALRSVMLDVDTHPDYSNLLLVRFRIQNTARYPQAVPSAELSFSNTDGQMIASRRFSPDHYLLENLRSQAVLGPGSEIDGVLELLNPGDDAVNYSLEFVYENR